MVQGQRQKLIGELGCEWCAAPYGVHAGPDLQNTNPISIRLAATFRPASRAAIAQGV
jgi:hypothetical protein